MEPFQLQKKQNEPVLFMLQKWIDSAPGLTAGFTTRIADEQGTKACNTALHVGDDPANVIANRTNIASSLGFDLEAWTCAEQVHGNHVARVTRKERGKGRLSRESAVQQTDGLTTNESDVLLTSFYADCVPLYFFDPESKAIGLAHAGWKGTVLNIAGNMIRHFEEQYGTDRQRLLAAIGPSIGTCCYEVDERVIEKVKQLSIPVEIVKKMNGHYDLDLKECNRQLMIKAGINPNCIEISTWCTSCEPEFFFSHRRDQGKTGRMASWIGWKKG